MTIGPIRETRNDLREAMQLTHKSILRSIEFQLYFDIAYIFILLFIAQIILQLSVDFFDKTISYLRIGSAIDHIPLLSFIDLHALFVLLGSIFLLALFYLIETNAIIIITSSYYRNTPISSFRAFIRACTKTPHVLMVRIVDLQIHFYSIIGLYFLWHIFIQIFPHMSFVRHWGGIGLLIYFALLILTLLFHYTMSAYVICLEKNESPYRFTDHITTHTQKRRTKSTVAFYLLFLLVAIIWIIFFSLVTKGMIVFSHYQPSIISHTLTVFFAGTVMSIFLFLSITKTLRISILTILYHKERQKQHHVVPINISSPPKQKNLTTIMIIFTMIAFGMCIIIFSTYDKTAQLVSHTEEFIHAQKPFSIHDMPTSSDAFVDRFLSKDHTTIDIIENVLFSYIAMLFEK